MPSKGSLFSNIHIYMLCYIIGESDGRNLDELEELIWDPEAGTSDRQIDQFLVIAR